MISILGSFHRGTPSRCLPVSGHGNYPSGAALSYGTLCILLWLSQFVVNPQRAFAYEWATETIESNVTSNARNSSVAVDANGVVHVLYYDENESGAEQLKYAQRTGGSWTIEVLDSAKGDQTVIEFDSLMRPHIFYNDIRSGQLVHGYREGGVWNLENINRGDLRGPRSGVMALGTDNAPQVAFVDGAPHYAERTGAGWQSESLPFGILVGAISLDAQDAPIIFGSSGRLYAASQAGSSWDLSIGTPFDLVCSINIDSTTNDGSTFHLSAIRRDDFNSSVGTMMHVVYDGSSWSSTAIESGVLSSLANTSIAIDPWGLPRITYEAPAGNTGGEIVKHATFDGSGWVIDSISMPVVQSGTALAIGNDGASHVVYWSSEGSLMYATALIIPEPTSVTYLSILLTVAYFRRYRPSRPPA